METANRDVNPELIQAIRGLCDGVQTGMLCGIFTSAACFLSLLHPEDTYVLITDLDEWFKNDVGKTRGGINCDEILSDDPTQSRCPEILAATYDKVMELLEARGHEL